MKRPTDERMPSSATATRRWGRLLLLLAILLTLAGWYAWQQLRGVTPPAVPAQAEAEVAQALEAARQDVLRTPRSASAWGTLGMMFVVNGYPTEGQACLREAARLDPGEPQWPYLLAVTLLPGDRKGLDYLEQAVHAYRPDDKEGNAARLLLAEMRLEEGDWDAAGALARAALVLEPQSARAHFVLGSLALTRDEPAAAVAELEQAVAGPETRLRAAAQLASAYRRLGDEVNAARCARLARTLPAEEPWQAHDPYLQSASDYVRGRRRQRLLATQLGAQGQLPEQVSVLSDLKDGPDGDQARQELGETLRWSGKFTEAEAIFRELAQRRPEWLAPRVQLMQTLYDAAEQCRQAAAARDSYRATRAAARAVLERKADSAVAHFYLGLAQLKLGQTQDAVAALEQAVRCDPSEWHYHHYLGQALTAAGRYEAARTSLEQALHLARSDENRAAVRQTLTDLRTKKGG